MKKYSIVFKDDEFETIKYIAMLTGISIAGLIRVALFKCDTTTLRKPRLRVRVDENNSYLMHHLNALCGDLARRILYGDGIMKSVTYQRRLNAVLKIDKDVVNNNDNNDNIG